MFGSSSPLRAASTIAAKTCSISTGRFVDSSSLIARSNSTSDKDGSTVACPEEVTVLVQAKAAGDAGALAAGFEHARGARIVTLAPFFQFEPEALRCLELLEEEGVDLVIGRRYPRMGSRLNNLQSAIYHALVRRMRGFKFRQDALRERGIE